MTRRRPGRGNSRPRASACTSRTRRAPRRGANRPCQAPPWWWQATRLHRRPWTRRHSQPLETPGAAAGREQREPGNRSGGGEDERTAATHVVRFLSVENKGSSPPQPERSAAQHERLLRVSLALPAPAERAGWRTTQTLRWCDSRTSAAANGNVRTRKSASPSFVSRRTLWRWQARGTQHPWSFGSLVRGDERVGPERAGRCCRSSPLTREPGPPRGPRRPRWRVRVFER